MVLNSWPAIAFRTIASEIAQRANFDRLTLARDFNRATSVVNGHTGGSYSLSSIANRDYKNRPCIGYGDPDPDHIIVLEENLAKLTLQVDSRGKDTTIIVRGPDNIIRCGDDTGNNKDANIGDNNWKVGTYRVWVGSINPNQNWDYSLYAR